MDNMQYKLKYLPLFYDDLAEAVDYISVKLQNPESAKKLIDLTERAILNRLDNPTGFQPIQTKKQRKYPYYRISVKNFSVYYVVIDNVMRLLTIKRRSLRERNFYADAVSRFRS